MHIKRLSGNLNGTDHGEDLGAVGKIIIRMDLKEIGKM
jgi:hypothetical protein